MEKKIRRGDRAIADKEARDLLQTGEYGILSTVSADGQPYGVPVSFTYQKDVIYFHCALEGHKLENLRGNNRVSFCVVGKTQVLPDKFATKYESVIVFGKASEVSGDEKHKGFVTIVEKYSPDFMEEGLKYIVDMDGKARMYKIAIESVTGKSRK